MGSGRIYDEDDSRRTKHRTDEGDDEHRNYDRPRKRSHRDRDSPEAFQEPPSHEAEVKRPRWRQQANKAELTVAWRYRVTRHRYSSPDKGDRENSQPAARRSGPLPSQADSFAVSNGEEPEKPKEKPNFGNTGALAAASNSVTQADGTTITLKYHEPPEARKPPARDQWKLFVFKGNDVVDTIELGSRSCWLVGRETTVVDMVAEHPSISKQHAVVQFRYTEKRNEFGDKIGRVKPFLIDLESANGTELNGEKVPDRRYLELRPKDVVKFGLSTREYVIMLARD
ncbi:hypothetical protein INS49_013825 [Diaporthe citri]|uniref:uncharacterized protein n=1 Tax=Diaporthe citri TaxID=83186 RepID=UPI001C7E98A1|nr:uncharacterized protein INS49_013825 [Diaporthe citri]KAG6357942.1 hypothetical protein INS49_013825 [Diaporthe citri]